MKFFSRGLFILAILAILIPVVLAAGSKYAIPSPFEAISLDTIPLRDRHGSFLEEDDDNPFDLDDPSIIEQNVEYDPETNMYIITERIGDDYFRAPTYMTFEEYLEWSEQKQRDDYFKMLSGIESGEMSSGGNIDPVSVVDVSQDIIDRLFGGTEVDIRPQGTIDLTFGYDYQKLDNPILLERQRRTHGFDFDMDIQVSVTGKIGEKLSTNFNYNTKSTFAFENKLKLDYNSQEFGEDDIIKKIEAGDVSLPLRGSLIQGSQSLFGIKTELQFGRLRLTAIASQQRSEKNNISIQGGSVLRDFEVPIDEYDENRHFLLSHYNRGEFEIALENLPQINSLFRVTRIEVWVTNDKNQTTDVRDIVAIADLGESRNMAMRNRDDFISPSDTANLKDICGTHVLPANSANQLLAALTDDPTIRFANNVTQTLINPPFELEQTRDFEKVRARLLSPTEYTFHPDLGFISLNIRLQPDQILGVAYEYTYNGESFKVGELTSDVEPNPDEQSVLFVKMLKSTSQRVDLPMWDLMMKNFYFIQGTDVNPDEFELDIYYEDPGEGFKRFLPTQAAPDLQNLPLITIFNLDNLNATGDPQPDGRFDFVPGLTIYPRQGKIMIPVLEPFGSYLGGVIDAAGGDSSMWAYNQLYDSTLVRAQEFPEFNRFTIRGQSQSSSSSDISLGAFNIPPGSVNVTAGGQTLEEGVDYIVDYNIGRLKIINDTYLQPGTPINVSFEDNALFSFQKKTMLGLRADYEVSKNLSLGATYMHLFERPYTQKVNIGDDPINNRIYGLDLSYSNEAPWLTRFVDNIPLIDTKEPSNINFQAEFAALKPGHSRAINKGQEEKEGVVYIDDFEGTASEYDLRTPPNSWKLASIPQKASIDNQEDYFEEANLFDTLVTGYNRAHLSWYRIDRSIRGGNPSNPYTDAVNQQVIFPNRTPRFGPNDFRTFDLYYEPTRRGQYNFDLPGGSGFSAGLNQDCTLKDPVSRWAGIQRQIDNSDFEQANYESLEFWMLNPFILPEYGSDGYLMINLGSISEDVLKDSRLMYEHGLPKSPEEAQPALTNWGAIPRIQPVVNAFSNEPGAREKQDVGLDGLPDTSEARFYEDYINAIIASQPTQQCIDSVQLDPSNDNFLYFRDDYYEQTNAGILKRYSRYNGTEGNSPENQGGGFISAYTNIPDSEDLNGDYSLNESESYWQYQIPIRRDPQNPDRMQFSEFVTDTIGGSTGTWYRFKIPLDAGESRGGIADFRSIRFMRMYVTGFEQQTVLRFATLDLVRSQWRRYTREMCGADNPDGADLSIDAVSVEEHSARLPFNYVIPPGITRERIVGSTYQDIFQNEQSLSFKFCDLTDDCNARVYKILNLDMRVFKNIQMFVHAEADETFSPDLPDGALTLFLRFGSDFENNYYEYEVPLVISRDDSDPANKEEIWKIENEIDFPLSLFTDLKVERNNAGVPLGDEYRISVNDVNGNPRNVSVRGNPTLGYVKHVMIGLRNPDEDDYVQPICGEVWVNELRAVGLDEKGGVAALARVDMQLADFGEVGLSTTYSSIGYGAIDQKLDERSKEAVLQFDASAGLELGNFFGQKAGVKIPFYAQYSVTKRTPRYDPYDLDIELKDKLDEAPDDSTRDSIRQQAIDHSALKVISVTNMRKERSADKQTPPMPWDISNFSVSYSLTQSEARNEVVEKDDLEHHKGSLDYNYSLKPLYIQPLKKLSDSKWLKPFTEFNINPIPNSFAFSTILDRRFGERSYRFSDPVFKTWFDKRFTWDRRYNLKWDLTRSIKIDFNATNEAVIDEPDEYIDRFTLERIPVSDRRDSVWQELKEFGRTKNYQHAVRASYNIPTKHFPFLDWVRADISVDANYSWTAASENTVSLGNVIQNRQGRKLTADLDFTRLYGKSKYLRKINDGNRSSSQRGRGPVRGSEDGRDARDQSRAGDRDDKKEAEPTGLTRALFRPLMAIRKFRFNYAEDYTTVVPGFTPQSELLGMEGFGAPGWDFIFGFQPDITARDSDDWLRQSREDGWFTNDVFQNQPIYQTESKTLDGRLTIEPFRDFKIDIDAKRSYSENFTVFYKNILKDNPNTPFIEEEFARRSPREVGSFSITYLSIPTLFKDDLDQMRDLFVTFEENRQIISQIRGTGEHPIDTGYTIGFGAKQRDIVIPAFLAAYTDKDPKNMELKDAFDWLPRPNWQLTYDGLQKIPLFEELFSSVRLTHGYKSTLAVNSFETDLSYTEYDEDGNFIGQSNPENINASNQNYYSRYIVPSVVIDEAFSPLIGIEVKTKNDISLRFNYAKRRGLRLGLTDYILEEDRATSIDFGFDYAIKNVRLPFGNQKKSRQREEEQQRAGRGGPPVRGNDLEFIFDFSFTDNITVNHTLDQESLPQPTRGTREIVISPAVRYNLNKNVDLRFFLDYRKSEPYTTITYPITRFEGGITVQVTLE